MHDPTEGGGSGGIHEMADASNVGVKIFEEKIRVRFETSKICEFFQVDPLQLISSGALLISAKSGFASKIIESLGQQHIHASIIGEFTENLHEWIMMRKEGNIQALPRPLSDHLWLALLRK